MKLILAFLLLYPILAVAQTPRDTHNADSSTLITTASGALDCQTCPSAPEVQQPEPHVRLWTFRQGPDRPPLYSNKGLAKSKLFLVSHLSLWTVAVLACRNPRSHEHWDEMGAVAGVTVMDGFGMKYFSPLFGFIGPAIGIPHYIKADLK